MVLGSLSVEGDNVVLDMRLLQGGIVEGKLQGQCPPQQQAFSQCNTAMLLLAVHADFEMRKAKCRCSVTTAAEICLAECKTATLQLALRESWMFA